MKLILPTMKPMFAIYSNQHTKKECHTFSHMYYLMSRDDKCDYMYIKSQTHL